jgi:tagatose 6-phosphate kinase
MKKYVLTVTLNPAIDHFKFSGKKEIISAGGKGINVARALNNFKIPVLATGLIGGTSGELIKGLLIQEGIPYDFVEIKSPSRVNQTYVGKRITRRMGQDPRIRFQEQTRFKAHFVQLLKRASCVVFSGRLAVGLPDHFYQDLIELAHKHRIRSVVDTSGNALKQALEAGPWLIKPNQEEFKEILGGRSQSLQNILEVLNSVHDKNVDCILLSAGSHGAWGSDHKHVYYVAAPRINVLHDVGCGDSFLAGFLYAHYKKHDFVQALQLAVASGSANAQELIPGLIRQNILLKLLKRIKVKMLA